MTRKYKLGDVCVAYIDPDWTYTESNFDYNGEECIIAGIVEDGHYLMDGYPEYVEKCYRVTFGDGLTLFAKEHELRSVADDTWVKQKIANLIDGFVWPKDML
jgi:phosphoribosylformylglycinamidine (FGAM) synthase-like amidotransferase family enzyme